MNITLPAALADGDTLTAAKYNAPWTALTGYTIALSDLATQYAPHSIVISTPTLLAAGTFVVRAKVPAAETWYPVQAEDSFQSTAGASTLTFQFTAGGTPVLNTAVTVSAAATLSGLQTSMAVSTIVGGTELVFTLTNTGANTATNCSAMVHFKVKLTA